MIYNIFITGKLLQYTFLFFFWCSSIIVLRKCSRDRSGGLQRPLNGQPQSEQPQTLHERKRRHGNRPGFRGDRYQIALCALRQETPNERKYLSDHYSLLSTCNYCLQNNVIQSETKRDKHVTDTVNKQLSLYYLPQGLLRF